MKLKRKILPIFSLFATLGGCTTMNGDYELKVYDAAGKRLMENSKFLSQGGMNYTIRNAICANNPGASIVITDIHTGQEMKGGSPYNCK